MEFLMNCCIHEDILDTIQIIDKKLLHFKLSKSGQILHVDKTSFPSPGHICDRAFKNLAYLHKLHMFRKWYFS